MNIFSFLTEKELLARKRWLVLFFIQTFILPILSVCSSLQEPHLSPLVAKIAILIYIVGLFLSAYLIYHCAYKKHGTKFLTIWLVATPLSTAFFFPAMLKEYTSTPSLIWIAFSNLFYVYYYFACLNLRKINKKIQFQKRSEEAVGFN